MRDFIFGVVITLLVMAFINEAPDPVVNPVQVPERAMPKRDPFQPYVGPPRFRLSDGQADQ